METPTPRDNDKSMERLVMVPPLISSTCLFKTCTAGSANTTTRPMINPNTANKVGCEVASCSPIL